MRNKNTVKISFIRHGKTELNEKHCYIGVTDISLSENGIREICKKKEEISYPNSDVVFVSPLKRCKETAAIIFPDVTQIEIEEFREMDFGSFEGKCYEELKDNLYYRRWIDESRGASKEEIIESYGVLEPSKNVGILLPESMDSFSKRVLNGLNKVLLSMGKLEAATVVTHGGVIMAIASTFVGKEFYKFMVSCAEGFEALVTYTEENGNIEISHFSINNWIRA